MSVNNANNFLKTPRLLAGREKKELKPKKKIGRPKGSKSKKTTKALDRITTPSWSNSDCEIMFPLLLFDF